MAMDIEGGVWNDIPRYSGYTGSSTASFFDPIDMKAARNEFVDACDNKAKLLLMLKKYKEEKDPMKYDILDMVNRRLRNLNENS